MLVSNKCSDLNKTQKGSENQSKINNNFIEICKTSKGLPKESRNLGRNGQWGQCQYINL